MAWRWRIGEAAWLGIHGLFGAFLAGYHDSMRIVCPACTATYDVPEARLAPGRAVRCARCGMDWMPLAVETEPLQPAEEMLSGVPEPAPAPPPPLAGTGTARPRRADAVALAGWAVSLALLAGLGWGGVRWRDDVMRAWPPSERLYAALGLAADQAAQ